MQINTITIGLDRSVTDQSSRTFNRIKGYANYLKSIHLIVFTKEEDQKKSLHYNNIHIYPTNSKSRIHFFKDVFRIFKKIQKENIFTNRDTVISTQDAFETGLAGYFLRRKYKLPLHLQIHIDFFSRHYRLESFRFFFQYLLAKFLIPRADSIRIVSQKMLNFFTRKWNIPKEKISILPIYTEPIDLEKAILPIREKYPHKYLFLVIARLVKQKDIPMAISAIKYLINESRDAGLLIVGSGKEESRLKKYSEGYEKFIHFESWVDDIASYFKAADALLLPSVYEGWGRTVIEAAYCKTPTLMTDIGCAGEFLVDGYNGFIFPVKDLRQFIKKLQKFVSNSDLREKMSDAAYKQTRSLESIDAVNKLYSKSLELAIKNYHAA